jgi:hypothetical protein
MKLETGIIITKGICVTSSTTLLALSSGLSQWSNAGTPSTMQWVMIIGASLGAGLGSLGAFMSGSFGNYVKARNGSATIDEARAAQALAAAGAISPVP